MRRKEKEIIDKSLIEKILNESDLCRIAMFDGNEPYIVPLNYGYANGVIYGHSAPAGRKIEILKINSRVCFEIVHTAEVIRKDEACKWTERYRSVIGYANVEIVTDAERKKKGLDIIMQKHGYQGKGEYNEGSLSRMVLLEMKIEKITGKQSGDW